MSTKRIAVTVSIAVSAVGLAPAAHAGHGTGGGPLERVRGAGENIFNTRFRIDVHTVPGGEEPRGRFSFEVPGFPPPLVNDATPTCLRVEGNRATLGGRLRRPVDTPAGPVGAVLVTITDGGRDATEGVPFDGVTFNPVPAPPAECPPPNPVPDDALTRGYVTVHDGGDPTRGG